MVDEEIRPARDEEAESVRECVRAAYSKYVERIGREPAPMLDDYGALIGAGEAWVLTQSGEILGILVIRRAEDHLFVENVAVQPEAQGRGLGWRLMRFAEERAAGAGLSEIRLYTNEKMWENVSLYERLGYQEIGRRLDEGYRRVFFSKKVDQEVR